MPNLRTKFLTVPLGSAKPATQHAPSLSIGAVHLKHILRDIETDDGRIGHFSSSRLLPLSLGIAPTVATGVKGGPCHHVRRKFFDVHAATGSPIAKEALDRIGDLYKIDKTIAGLPPDVRRGERQQRSKPIAEALAAWAETTLRRLSRKSELAKAFRYMRSRWKALLRCFDDGRLALDNNPAERALRCVAIGRKNYLFAGSDAGGHRAAAIYSLIETAKLNRRNPQHYLADVLARIADHPARKIADLLPWNWTPADLQRAAA